MTTESLPEIGLIVTLAEAKDLHGALSVAEVALEEERKSIGDWEQSWDYHKMIFAYKDLNEKIQAQIREAVDTHEKDFFKPVRPWFLWKSVRLENKSSLPETPGIYIVISLWNVLYVGKAQNLKARWQGTSHHRYDQARQTFLPRLYYIDLPLPAITRTEEYLIEKLNPVWNWSPALYRKYAESSRTLRVKLNFLELGLIATLLTVLYENRETLLQIIF